MTSRETASQNKLTFIQLTNFLRWVAGTLAHTFLSSRQKNWSVCGSVGLLLTWPAMLPIRIVWVFYLYLTFPRLSSSKLYIRSKCTCPLQPTESSSSGSSTHIDLNEAYISMQLKCFLSMHSILVSYKSQKSVSTLILWANYIETNCSGSFTWWLNVINFLFVLNRDFCYYAFKHIWL
jgi:hypothetical protein